MTREALFARLPPALRRQPHQRLPARQAGSRLLWRLKSPPHDQTVLPGADPTETAVVSGQWLVVSDGQRLPEAGKSSHYPPGTSHFCPPEGGSSLIKANLSAVALAKEDQAWATPIKPSLPAVLSAVGLAKVDGWSHQKQAPVKPSLPAVALAEAGQTQSHQREGQKELNQIKPNGGKLNQPEAQNPESGQEKIKPN